MSPQAPEVVGMVTRDGIALAGVLVNLCLGDRDPHQQMYTDANGTFRFRAPPGTWRVEIPWASGTRAKSVEIGSGSAAYLHFDLTQ